MQTLVIEAPIDAPPFLEHVVVPCVVTQSAIYTVGANGALLAAVPGDAIPEVAMGAVGYHIDADLLVDVDDCDLETWWDEAVDAARQLGARTIGGRPV